MNYQMNLLSPKRLFFNLFLNPFLFLILFIVIQNSSNKERVNLLIDETIELPLSFIIGTSFLTGSILGQLVPVYKNKKFLKSY